MDSSWKSSSIDRKNDKLSAVEASSQRDRQIELLKDEEKDGEEKKKKKRERIWAWNPAHHMILSIMNFTQNL